MTSRPYLKFWTSDWRSDPELRSCSSAARGLWIDMLCLMHEAEPRGHLLVSGRAPTLDQLAKLVGMDKKECSDCLGELSKNGVFSVRKSGVIFSRKIVRDEKKSRINRENGAMGGNPALKVTRGNRKDNSGPVNPTDNGGDKAGVSPISISTSITSIKTEASASVFLEARARGKTQIPPDSIISNCMLEHATGRGLSLPESEAQFAKFRDHALANGKTFADWDAAWRGWLSSPNFSPIIGAPKLNGSRKQTYGEQLDDRLDELKARLAVQPFE